MVKLEKKQWKKNYFERLITLMNKYTKCLVVGVDNVRSKQMQEIRIDMRGKAELLMGKNTMIRRCFRDNMEEFPFLANLLPHIVGNIGFCFTDMDLVECRELLVKNKVQASAKAGVIAPCDVVIPAGPTTMGPEKTSFFQALNLSTKIARGTIEILAAKTVCVTGERVGLSEAKLLNMLNISPFFYGLELKQIVDNKSVFPPAVLDITADAILEKLSKSITTIAALSLSLGIPNRASTPHMIFNGFKNILAIAVATEYTFTEAEKVKAYLANPDAFASNEPAASSGGDNNKADAPPPAPEPEEESEEDMDMGLFD